MDVRVQRPVRLVADAVWIDVCVGMGLPNRGERSRRGHIERMAGLPKLGKAQAQHGWEECRDFLASVHKCAVIAPGANDCSALLGQTL